MIVSLNREGIGVVLHVPFLDGRSTQQVRGVDGLASRGIEGVPCVTHLVRPRGGVDARVTQVVHLVKKDRDLPRVARGIIDRLGGLGRRGNWGILFPGVIAAVVHHYIREGNDSVDDWFGDRFGIVSRCVTGH